MAKLRKSSTIKPVSEVLRHLNKQTTGADASVVIGEAIANPAYREAVASVYLGIMILAVRVFAKITAPFGNGLPVLAVWSSQIQTGDQSGTPALMDLDNEFLFAHGDRYSWAASSVGFAIGNFWPVTLQPIKGTSVIVTPEFTVVHDAGVNNAEYNSEEVHTVIEYQVVEVPDRVFTNMLMNQSRTS